MNKHHKKLFDDYMTEEIKTFLNTYHPDIPEEKLLGYINDTSYGNTQEDFQETEYDSPYCPVCSSCGYIGCCNHSCFFCEPEYNDNIQMYLENNKDYLEDEDRLTYYNQNNECVTITFNRNQERSND